MIFSDYLAEKNVMHIVEKLILSHLQQLHMQHVFQCENKQNYALNFSFSKILGLMGLKLSRLNSNA